MSDAWLRLREPVDAASRAVSLLDAVRDHLHPGRPATIRDLAAGTGSMTRWLAPRLASPQHWVLYDHDAELLDLAADCRPVDAAGRPVRVETRTRDITRLSADDLGSAELITASALLDMLTARELDRIVAASVGAGRPVWFTLTVTGRVELDPADPMDAVIVDAFNAHQRRATPRGRLLGPDAVEAAAAAFAGHGMPVRTAASPWRLGPERSPLIAQWLVGWLAAACSQRPGLAEATATYAARRLAEAAAGRLSITVHHTDLLAGRMSDSQEDRVGERPAR